MVILIKNFYMVWYILVLFILKNSLSSGSSLPNGIVIENNIIKSHENNYSSIFQANVGKIFLDAMNKKLDSVLLIDVDKKENLNFKDLKDRSIRCAIWLKKQNVGIGDIVSLNANKQVNNYVIPLAAFFIGAVYYPWGAVNSIDSPKTMQLIKPKVVFSKVDSVDILMEAAKSENITTKFVVFDKHNDLESFNDILSSVTIEEVEKFKTQEIKDLKNTPAFIFSTSGSTGQPKGVVHSYESLLANFIKDKKFLPYKIILLDYTTIDWMSNFYFFISSMFENRLGIIHKNFDIEQTPNVIEDYKINYLFLSPSHIGTFVKSGVLKSKINQFTSVKTLVFAGSKLNIEILKEFRKILPHVQMVNSYGSTEVPSGTSKIYHDFDILPNSIGFLQENLQLKIVNETTGTTLGPNSVGEICIKSPVMMLGYYKNPALTEKAIDKEGWFHTGDRGMYNENSEIFFLDRIKDLMKYQNHQVSPSEIESLLETLPDILEVVVVPVPNLLDGERPMAFVKKAPNSKVIEPIIYQYLSNQYPIDSYNINTITEEDLIKFSRKLGEFKYLSGGVRFLDSLPRLNNGKIARNKLKDIAKTFENK